MSLALSYVDSVDATRPLELITPENGTVPVSSWDVVSCHDWLTVLVACARVRVSVV